MILLTSCGNLKNLATKARVKRQQKAMEKLVETSSEEATARLGANALGEISYVADAEQYVLVRPLAGVSIPDTATLESRENGKRNALMKATSARNKDFIAADILEGNPKTGDAIFLSEGKRTTTTGRPATPPPSTPPGREKTTTGPPPGDASPAVLPQDLIPPPIQPGGFDPAHPEPLPPPIESVEDLRRR